VQKKTLNSIGYLLLLPHINVGQIYLDEQSSVRLEFQKVFPILLLKHLKELLSGMFEKLV